MYKKRTGALLMALVSLAMILFFTACNENSGSGDSRDSLLRAKWTHSLIGEVEPIMMREKYQRVVTLKFMYSLHRTGGTQVSLVKS